VPSTVYDSRNPQDSVLGSIGILIERRRLVISFTKIDVLNRYKKSVLGVLWSFINPLLISSVIYFVFGRIFNNYMPETRGYASWVLSGVLLQGLLLSGITISSSALQSNMGLISRNRIQPIIMSFSSSLSHVTHFSIGIISLAPLAILTNQTLSLRIFLLPIYLLLVSFWLTGLGLLLVGWFMRFDDAAYLFNASMMVVSYLSPFLYPVAILGDRIRGFVEINPITSWIVTFRWLVYEKQTVEVFNIAFVFASSLLTFIAGILWLRNRWNDYVML
jgi:ABC-type polysaccharide/polyol phosphate export permease